MAEPESEDRSQGASSGGAEDIGGVKITWCSESVTFNVGLDKLQVLFWPQFPCLYLGGGDALVTLYLPHPHPQVYVQSLLPTLRIAHAYRPSLVRGTSL